MHRQEFYMASGKCTIGTLQEFVSKFVNKTIVQGHTVHYPVIEYTNSLASFETSDSMLCGPSIKDMVVELDRGYEVSSKFLVRYGKVPLDYLEASAMEEIKTLILKKGEEFYVPALNMNEIHDLSHKLLEKSGGDGDVFGFHHAFSEYQNYFVMCHKKTFMTYYTEPRPAPERDAYVGYSKTVELNPNSWVVGRSDDPTAYMKEVDAMRRYDVNFDELSNIIKGTVP